MDIQHGIQDSNHVSHCLLRVLVCSVKVGVDFSSKAANQPCNPDVLALRSTCTGLKVEDALMQEAAPPSSAMSPVALGLLSFCIDSFPLAPWRSGVGEVGQFQVRLAWLPQGLQGVGSCMCDVPAD